MEHHLCASQRDTNMKKIDKGLLVPLASCYTSVLGAGPSALSCSWTSLRTWREVGTERGLGSSKGCLEVPPGVKLQELGCG